MAVFTIPNWGTQAETDFYALIKWNIYRAGNTNPVGFVRVNDGAVFTYSVLNFPEQGEQWRGGTRIGDQTARDIAEALAIFEPVQNRIDQQAAKLSEQMDNLRRR